MLTDPWHGSAMPRPHLWGLMMNEEYVIESPPTKEEVAEKATMLVGIFKQLIALNASGIGLIFYFSDSMDAGHWLAASLLAFAPLAFMASLLASFLLFFLMTILQKPGEGDRIFQDRDQLIMFWVSFMGFVLGALSLMLIAWFNFFETLHPLAPAVLGLAMIGYGAFVLGKWIKKKRAASAKS